eukprot:COSAG04_NODE_586_length_12338_cov_16.547839_12_plen_24_part_01
MDWKPVKTRAASEVVLITTILRSC